MSASVPTLGEKQALYILGRGPHRPPPLVAEQTPPPPCYLPTALPDRDSPGPRPGSFPASPPHDDNQRAPLASTSGSSCREETPASILDTPVWNRQPRPHSAQQTRGQPCERLFVAIQA